MSIEFRNVTKTFWNGRGRKVILDDASFTIELGKSIGIFAKNGTGKSTVIKMMAGTEKPDMGRIYRNCKVSFPLGPIGGMGGKLSARENIRILARMHDMDVDDAEAQCMYIADIGEYFDQPMNTYSTGMAERTRYAILLCLDYDVYLIDESLPGTTDVEFNHRAGTLLADKLEYATAVIVSHEESLIREFCREAAVLKDGKLYFFDTIDEAKELYDWSNR